MLGNHVVKSWSASQSIVALSSGEAEHHGSVKGASLGLGIRGMLRDLGLNNEVAVKRDASAARGIVNRRGLGKSSTQGFISCGFRIGLRKVT